MSNQDSFPDNNTTRAAEQSPLLETNKIKLELCLHKETRVGCSANNYHFIQTDRVKTFMKIWYLQENSMEIHIISFNFVLLIFKPIAQPVTI